MPKLADCFHIHGSTPMTLSGLACRRTSLQSSDRRVDGLRVVVRHQHDCSDHPVHESSEVELIIFLRSVGVRDHFLHIVEPPVVF